MKRLNKFLWIPALAGLLAFTACDDGNVGTIYTPGTDEQGYSFITEQATQYFSTTYTQKVSNIVLGRNFTKGQATVQLSYDGLEEPLSAPESVTFEDGQAYVNIPVAVEGMKPGEVYEFSISFDPSLASLVMADEEEYDTEGISTVFVTFSVEYTWVSAGEVTMYTDWSGTEAIVPIEEAKEYEDEEGNHLYRLVNWMYCLEPDYAEEGYHYQFLLDENYNAVAPAAVWQLMGEEDEGALFGYYYDEEYDCAFENEYNTYFLYPLIAYEEAGELVLYDYEYAEWTWVKGYPGELPEPEPEPEPLTDLGEGFGVIVAGGNESMFTGDYLASFLNWYDDEEMTVEASVSVNEDGDYVLSGLSDEGYEIVLKSFAGLLYFQSQVVGSLTEEDPETGETYSYEVYALPYSTEEDDIVENALLVGGFCSDGSLAIINYPYNETAADAIVFMSGEGEDMELADPFIPSRIFLYPAEEEEEEPEADVAEDYRVRAPGIHAFSMKAAEKVMKAPIVKGMRVKSVR